MAGSFNSNPMRKSGLLQVTRRRFLGGAVAGAAVAALPACSRATVAAERTVDVAIIGGGIMGATMGVLLNQLEPGWTMEMFERLDAVARESSNGWHNAGTGHSALCELNYTTIDDQGNVNVDRALKVNEAFQVSRQYWASMVDRGVFKEPRSFINSSPHMSFVWGDENIEFLRERHAALIRQPLFSGMEFSTDPETIRKWVPLMMEGRDPAQKIAATRSTLGTDVDFGSITRQSIAHLSASEQFRLNLTSEVDSLTRNADGSWHVGYTNETDGTQHAVDARFVFIGAGGASILLLQESDIPESRSYGGFPVGGSFLVNRDPATVDAHLAKAYGTAAVGAPPMSVPHLDTRVINGEKVLLFGPFATFSTNFLMQGSKLDLLSSVSMTNLGPMVHVGLDEFDLVKYLVGQVLLSHEDQIAALREYLPQAKSEAWDLLQAGQRVQIINRDESGRGDLEFGTKMVVADDGSIAALLGASPGGSTAPATMIDALEDIFPEKFSSPEWQAKLRAIVPSLGTKLNGDPAMLAESWAFTSDRLQLDAPPAVGGTPA